jgi:hypothetical protein
MLKITDKIPFDLVEKYTLSSKILKEPACVKSEVMVNPSEYYETDQICHEILNIIAAASVGDTIAYKGSKKIKLARLISPVEAKKIRGDFLKICKTHPPKIDTVANSFIDYIEMVLSN